MQKAKQKTGTKPSRENSRDFVEKIRIMEENTIKRALKRKNNKMTTRKDELINYERISTKINLNALEEFSKTC